jgi:hypothetical protein
MKGVGTMEINKEEIKEGSMFEYTVVCDRNNVSQCAKEPGIEAISLPFQAPCICLLTPVGGSILPSKTLFIRSQTDRNRDRETEKQPTIFKENERH